MVTIKAGPLTELVGEIFAKAGCSKAEAGRIGKYLVSANLTGHDSHGVARVPRYLQWKRDGVVVADRKAKIVTETPVLAVVDGLHGFGQTVTPQAVAIGIDKCKAMGLSMVALKNAGHIGRVGDWAEMAAEAGLVSVHFVNASGSVLVAPFGGTERRLSTAPFCVGVPRPGEPPVVLDFATSVVAEGKVLVASQGGKKLPADALISPDGKMSADPRVLYGDYTAKGPAPGRQGRGRHPRLRRAQGLRPGPRLRAAGGLVDRHESHGSGRRSRGSLPRQRHALVLRRSGGGGPRGPLPRGRRALRRLLQERQAGRARG
jgi:uncharacterized oxidoreductase